MRRDEDLRPETVALDALIKATVQCVKDLSDAASPDAMLFMGNGHQAIPARVIQDPVLEPVDELVWMVIMLHARDTGGSTAFPGYDTIASKSNVLENVSKNHGGEGWLFTFNASVIRGLKNASETPREQASGQHQNSKTEEKEYSTNTHKGKKAFSESSQSIPVANGLNADLSTTFVGEPEILADRYLAQVAPEDLQLLLDELQGRLEQLVRLRALLGIEDKNQPG